ncbi:UNVERIFIED_CONTAM: Pentatricopeptide repeat-containing protein [Sesamum latifolium]|uniref:Pentatricopeptide repeat-containing protein n=1 Tax=Sesamum latifolium TaxID=2727402 RepID=A0AAW2XGX6_9LAMI
MQKFLHSPIFRSIKPQYFTPSSTFYSLFDNALDNLNVTNEVLAVINSAHPIGPALQKLVPFLNREVIISVLQSQAQLKEDPRICFRFFIWAAEKTRFRSGLSHNLIVDMLLSGESGNSFHLYWSVLDELRDEKLPVPADAFVVLILGYWRLRKAEKAVETFGRMNDYECKPNLAAYNVILHVLVKKDVILLALAVYNMMLKSNCRIGCDTFNVLIDGLCKSGMTQDALNLFDEMTERGILPSRITYTVIMSGVCKAKRMHDAHRLFNLMKSSGCMPDALTYNALLDGFCKCGQIDEAFALFESFRNDGYRVGIKGFSCLIDGLIRAKRLSEAEELFQKVYDVGSVPDLVLYTIMMRGLCEAGRMKDAVNILRDMIGKGLVPDTQCYNVLIKGFCDIGLLDQARSLKLEISQHNQFPDTCTHTILVCGLCRNGLLGEAQQIFNDMEKLGCFPSVVTFNALIDGLSKAGKLEEAHLMLYKMEIGKNPSLFLRLSQGADRILDSASLQKMVDNLVNSGLILKAYKLLMQLADSGVVPNITTYNTLINGLCKAGQYLKNLSGRQGEALKSAEESFQNGDLVKAVRSLLEIDIKLADFDSAPYNIWLVGLCQADRVEEALKTFSILEEFNVTVSAPGCVKLIHSLCSEGKLDEAVDIFLYTMEKDLSLSFSVPLSIHYVILSSSMAGLAEHQCIVLFFAFSCCMLMLELVTLDGPPPQCSRYSASVHSLEETTFVSLMPYPEPEGRQLTNLLLTKTSSGYQLMSYALIIGTMFICTTDQFIGGKGRAILAAV